MLFYRPQKSDIDWGVAEVDITFLGSVKQHTGRSWKSIIVLLYNLVLFWSPFLYTRFESDTESSIFGKFHYLNTIQQSGNKSIYF